MTVPLPEKAKCARSAVACPATKVPEAGLFDARVADTGPVCVVVVPEHASPVVVLKPLAEVQPAGNVLAFTLSHYVPVVGLYPEAEVQPGGKFPETAPPVHAALLKGPNIPSAVRPTLACHSLTAALVFVPKYEVSEPGEPAPVTDRVNPATFNPCWSSKT